MTDVKGPALTYDDPNGVNGDEDSSHMTNGGTSKPASSSAAASESGKRKSKFVPNPNPDRAQRARYGVKPAGSGGDGSASSSRYGTGRKGDGGSDNSLTEALWPGEVVEVQHTRCRTPRYAVVEKCRACKQNSNEQCRFRYMRRRARDGVVVRSLGTFEHGSGYRLNTLGASIAAHSTATAKSGGSSSRSLQAEAATAEHARYVLSHLHGPFESLVREEISLSEGEDIVIVNAKARGAPPKSGPVPAGYSKDGGERQICDWCLSTLFFRYRTCRRCGIEVCLHCAAEWRVDGRPQAVSKICNHPPSDWLVFAKVSTHVMLSLTQSARRIGAAYAAATAEDDEQQQPSLNGLEEATSTFMSGGVCVPCMQPPSVDGGVSPPTTMATNTGHSSSSSSSSSSWLRCWQAGIPTLVPNVTNNLNVAQWTPTRFSQEFGELEVMLVDVRTAKEFASPLKVFFDGFGSAAKRPQPPARLLIKANGTDEVKSDAGEVTAPMRSDGAPQPGEEIVVGGEVVIIDSRPPLLKLKDWPPTRDFAEVLPRHFTDLMGAMPQPSYTRRTGTLNLASKLPVYTLPPDLGPKMYIAYGALVAEAEEASLFGTTCLHMDMSDAVNLMVYVEPDPPGSGGSQNGYWEGGVWRPLSATSSVPSSATPAALAAPANGDDLAALQRDWPTAGAVWDIWAADDEPALTAFLWRIAAEESGDEKARQEVGHPIHDANVYLTANLRKRRLWEEEGVRGYRFVQRAGEAVFIPAGCPHQVYNIRSSIKVAEDFVSPEHISRCLKLTEQFSALPLSHRRKQDTLGVKDIMLHAISYFLA